MGGEFTFIDWIRGQTPAAGRVLIGPGDDCAALSPGGSPWLITTDMLMDGTDFILAEVGPHCVGRKAMAVNLSDLAAMAGRPVGVVVSVALPVSLPPPLWGRVGEGGARLLLEEFSPGQGATPHPNPPPQGGREQNRSPSNLSVAGSDLAQQLYRGLREMADAFGVPIVGGDTNSWTGPLVISVTAFGEADRPVRRTGAKPGDWLFVTGPLGGSILGHHLDFTPRIVEALKLSEAVELHAMIDVSDGLSADLYHILEESRCGAVLHAEAIPIADAALRLAEESGKTPLDHALGDGEDFELVFAVSPADGEKLLREPPVPVWKIGECVADGYWIEEQKTRRPLVPTGWVHSL